MKVKLITLGCKVNQYESQAMLEALLQAGYTEASPAEPAGVVVVNSCTVTAQSDHKVRQALRRAKRDNPGCVAVLTGCMPQAFPQAAAALLEADIVLGNARRADLVPRLREFLATKQRLVDVAPHTSGEPFEPLSVSAFSGRTRAFLKIQDGCNRFCSYCIIPYARGRVRSKPLEDLRREAGPGWGRRVQRGGAHGHQPARLRHGPGPAPVRRRGRRLRGRGHPAGAAGLSGAGAADPPGHRPHGQAGEAVPPVPPEFAVRLRRDFAADEPPLHHRGVPPDCGGFTVRFSGLCHHHRRDGGLCRRDGGGV